MALCKRMGSYKRIISKNKKKFKADLLNSEKILNRAVSIPLSAKKNNFIINLKLINKAISVALK